MKTEAEEIMDTCVDIQLRRYRNQLMEAKDFGHYKWIVGVINGLEIARQDFVTAWRGKDASL